MTLASCLPIRYLIPLITLASCPQVLAQAPPPPAPPPPNFVIVFADDLGYGDLSSFGHPTLMTPHLDTMAREGQRWTNFYAGASVCTPSRAALLTGRLPVRSGMASNVQRVLFPDSREGLPPEEITLAEQLRSAGYATGAIGKWHLGHLPPHLPTAQGFDEYFGIPYSNDMDRTDRLSWTAVRTDSFGVDDFQVPLMRDTEIIERPANQHTITQRYTDEAVAFIKRNSDQPFFLYLAHNLPHIPLFAGERYMGTSERGLYGDVVGEIDAGVGEIKAALRAEGLDSNTIVVFTSDNGPWLLFNAQGGSAGLLRGGKGMTYEGGMREPTVIWGPGYIQPATVTGIGSTMDLFATFSAMAGVPLPTQVTYDSYDLSPTLAEGAPSPRERLLYYRGPELYAARLGDYKAHYITQGEYGAGGPRVEHNPPLLYHLGVDPSEQYDIADEYPEVLVEIAAMVAEHRAGLEVARDRLAARGE